MSYGAVASPYYAADAAKLGVPSYNLYGAQASKSDAGRIPELLLDRPGGPRTSLNFWALGQCLLLPWGLFAGALYLMSFAARYQHAELVWTPMLFGLAVPLVFGARAVALRGSAQGGTAQPTWHLFMAATCLAAWVLGFVVGSLNYAAMTKYYDYTNLSFPRDVDPRSIPGGQFLDAGGMYFSNGSKVNQDFTMGFKDGSVYCVAPITMGDTKVASYDFWAVGIDCCTPLPPGSFWCGDSAFTPAAGLRFDGDEEVKHKFQLAIKQAMAEYRIAAKTPVLLTATADPLKELEAIRNSTRASFVTWLVVSALLHCALVTAAACFYQRGAKMP